MESKVQEEQQQQQPTYDPVVGSVVKAAPPKPQDNYDPLNPYGKWVEASPPREQEGEGEEQQEQEPAPKTRKQRQEEEDEKWAEGNCFLAVWSLLTGRYTSCRCARGCGF